MKAIFVAVVALVSLQAMAEEKTCQVKGMHCTECANTVQEKVCNDTYAVCEVKVVNEVKKLGQIHIRTKNDGDKISTKAINEAMKDVKYSLGKCTAGAPAPEKTDSKG